MSHISYFTLFKLRICICFTKRTLVLYCGTVLLHVNMRKNNNGLQERLKQHSEMKWEAFAEEE